MKNILTLITLYFTEDYMKTYMKTNELVKILAAFFLSAAALCASDYYFGTISGDYEASWPWFADESRTQPASGVPNQYGDSAIFYKTSASAWITRYDTYVGDVVFAGSSSIRFGNQLPTPDNYTAYFDAGGKISAQICGDWVTAVFGTSFDNAKGAVGIDITLGGIDVGTQVYGGKTFESYGYAILLFAFSDERITSSAIRVNGDVNVGGGLDISSSAVLDIAADKVEVKGVVNMKSNGGSYSNILFREATVFEIGGLNATSEQNDFTICNMGGFSSDIVFKNAAGTDFQFIGNICDDGNSLQYNHDGVVNIAMDGAGTQRIFQSMFSASSSDQYNAQQRGTVSSKSGRLFMDNSRIATDYRLAALSLEGGRFGAGHYDSSLVGTAYFKTADFQSGGLACENFANHNSIETQVSDKIIVSETFSKAEGSGKISVDFSDRNGNALDLQNYAIANDVSGIESWVEILSAGSLDGFDLESKLGGNIYDANGDFYAIGIENGVAVFRWAESLEDGGYALQVGFSQVPEPAVAAAIFGALALGLAARRRVG